MSEELFWSDKQAKKVIKERGLKKEYICAAGITPSGPKHIGNFREIITVDLIHKSLKKLGNKSRFLYFWDSYDRLRKIPSEVPRSKVELMKKEIGKPVSKAIDPWGCHKSWAEHWMDKLTKEVAMTGIKPEYIKQHELYEKGFYAEDIKKTLNNKEKIINILNKYRKEPLSNEWEPVMIYCEKCNKDTTRLLKYDGNYEIIYECECGYKSTIDFRKKGIIKLRWRADWPMRWAHYGVDFEPAGKEHMVMGSSRTTGEQIVKEVYGSKPPYGFMYGLVRRKGGEGKMSASKGNVIFVTDALKIYLPEVLRFIFISNRATKDFPITFDEDVLKIYEDFYQAERAYYDKSNKLSKRSLNLKRVYELCVNKPLKKMPIQLSFRTAALIVQIAPEKEWLNRVKGLMNVTKQSENRLKQLLTLAKNWVDNYAPEQYIINLNEKPPRIDLVPLVKKSLKELGKKLLTKKYTVDELNELIFKLARPVGMKEFFTTAYKVIISRNKGPKLAQFIISADQKKIGKLLSNL